MSETEILNMYELLPDDNKYYNPDPMAPVHPFRLICVGSSGSMKTNAVLNVIKKCNCFEKIYLICAQPDEPLWAHFSEQWKGIQSVDDSPFFTVSNKLEDAPDLEKDINPELQNLIIYDDQIGQGKKRLEKYAYEPFLRGRKKNCSVIFISQSYFDINKFIRLQATFVIFKELNDTRDQRLICSNLGIDDPRMIAFINQVQESDEKQFIMVQIGGKNKKKMKYRLNFDPIQFE